VSSIHNELAALGSATVYEAGGRHGCLGVYGSIVAPGRVAVGDPVLLQ